MDRNLLEAMQTLLEVFYERIDLQLAFPEVRSHDYRRLLDWALGVVQKRFEDSHYDVLKPFNGKYKSLSSMDEASDPALEKWLKEHLRAMFSNRLPLDDAGSGKGEHKKPISRMHSNPLVSVVITHYDRPRHLEKVLTAYQSQSYRNIEIIVVDDGSTRSQELERVIHGRDVSLYINHYKHCYFRAALCRNIGAARAQGEVIIFNDVDIIPEFDAVFRIVNVHSKNPNLIVCGNIWRIVGGLEAVNNMKIYKAEEMKAILKDRFSYLPWLKWSTINSVHRTEVWENFLLGFSSFHRKDILYLLGADPKFFGWGHEDQDIAYRIIRQGMKIGYFEDIMGFHIEHPEQTAKSLTFHRSHVYFIKKFPELNFSPTIVEEKRLFGEDSQASKRLPEDRLKAKSYHLEFRRFLKHPILFVRTIFRKRKPQEGSITVVIPTKNGFKYLQETVLSSIYQTRPPQEVYIVVDPSQDGTELLATELSRKFGEVQCIINRTERGMAESRNQGIVATPSDYIMLLDQDTILNSRYFEKVAKLLDHNPNVGIAYSDYVEFGEQNQFVKILPYDPKLLLVDRLLYSGVALVRRCALEEVGGFDSEQTFEDWELFIRLIGNDWIARGIDQILYSYRIHEGSRQLSARAQRGI